MENVGRHPAAFVPLVPPQNVLPTSRLTSKLDQARLTCVHAVPLVPAAARRTSAFQINYLLN